RQSLRGLDLCELDRYHIAGERRRRVRRSDDRLRRPSDGREGVLEVRENVFHVLDSHRHAHEPRRDAAAEALLGLDTPMRHRGRMRNEAFDTAQRFAERAHDDAIEKALYRLDRTEVEGDHPAEARHLPCRDRVAGMRRRARMRTGSVLMPRETRNESNGERIAPATFCVKPIFAPSRGSAQITAPPTE